MFAAFVNMLKIKELRAKLLFTAGIIVITRFAANIPCPGVDPRALKDYVTGLADGGSAGQLMEMFDIFSGGALQNFAVATLGIMPYITASIIMQLLTPTVPALEKLQREGDSGRQKISQYTRYLTILVCLFQGIMAAVAMLNPARLGMPVPDSPLIVGNESMFIIMTVVVLTCATMVLTWLGEQITERGIGNGVSLIITINIIARLPQAVWSLIEMSLNEQTASGANFRPVQLLILLLVFAAVTAATIMLSQGMRRIPIQMVRKSVGSQVHGGSTYMPLKVNFAGVMPIIFAGALLSIPGMALRFWQNAPGFIVQMFVYGSAEYMITYGILILAFSYFWVANQFNPIQISENLKKDGAYIPGIRPGQPTAEFLDHSMSRITFAGSLFLMALAIFPMILTNSFKVPMMVASFFGGTSLLIMVGVVLDTLTQLESHLTMRNYDGFLKNGRLRGRRGGN
ncbi:MAG: preprotein translocase subunit SecY [Victivallaceae bacterium]|jgi:preprotein translocase subunit SecY|nr:preprotein translocase subunit SecY [Victivallaceae bacterium]NLK82879.1 preprotein translocase subunit SecY [Lentisphaerota bacterium]MDD3116337.1 preprotein translocase subunit SecY [Victivallaceae bacterium]MDD3703307.1 preprotein translocase subunit SecY [Victivallaceae bacterium]MDD4317702.1 preprotein translocase subunit SecY [Victivallaceae bacterium]